MRSFVHAPRRESAGSGSYEGYSHVELLRECVEAGVEDAWDEFVARFNRYICLAVLRAYRRQGGRRSGRAEAELVNDLVQEVYVKLIESARGALRSFRGSGDAAVCVYLGRIAISVVVDYLRRTGARKRGPEVLSLDAPAFADDEGREAVLGERLPAPGRTPEEEALDVVFSSQMSALADRALRGRNAARDRAIITAFLFEDATPSEIAEAIGGRISEAGVKSSIYRSRTRLRSELERLERCSASRLASDRSHRSPQRTQI